MTDVFADTSYFLALLNPMDRDHARARHETGRRPGRLITKAWVMIELGSALSRAAVRQQFVRTYDRLRAQQQVVLVPAEQSWLDRGVTLYRQRPDKDWSLTDCISFLVMQQLGITEALTADEHFRQAGFRALLLDE